jgi:replicative DNA helicase
MNRPLPHDVELEQSMLAGLLIDSQGSIDALDALDPSDFYVTKHQLIFDAMRDQHRKGEPFDVVAIHAALNEAGKIDKAGGAVYLYKIMDTCPVPTNVEFCCKKVTDFATRRRLIAALNDGLQKSFQSNGGVDSVLDDVQKSILNVESKLNGGGGAHIKDLLPDAVDRLDDLSQRKTDVIGVPTGYGQIDFPTSGLQQSDLIIIAARPSMGKTALSLNIAVNAAKHGHPVAFFSIEMSKHQLVTRLLALESGVNALRIRTGNLNHHDFLKINIAAGKLNDLPIYIDDSAGLSDLEIRRRARRMRKQNGIELCCIDYLGLVSGDKQWGRVEEVSGITRMLKLMAKELDIPVVLLSQLSRACEQRADKRPILSDLRDSGAIEQDADVVLFLYRDEVYNENSKDRGIAEVHIAKQRQGPAGIRARLGWSGKTGRFYNIRNDGGHNVVPLKGTERGSAAYPKGTERGSAP